jgi:hypothetical protein
MFLAYWTHNIVPTGYTVLYQIFLSLDFVLESDMALVTSDSDAFGDERLGAFNAYSFGGILLL